MSGSPEKPEQGARGVSHLAFLRAINLGSTRKFGKDAVATATSEAGMSEVVTHLNTGNVGFRTRMRSRARIEGALERSYERAAGFVVPTIVFDVAELREVVETGRSLATSVGAGGKAYVSLLKDVPSTSSVDELMAQVPSSEVVRVEGRGVHLFIPESTGYHGATMTNAQFEKVFGVATNRTLNVLATVLEKWT